MELYVLPLIQNTCLDLHPSKNVLLIMPNNAKSQVHFSVPWLKQNLCHNTHWGGVGGFYLSRVWFAEIVRYQHLIFC